MASWVAATPNTLRNGTVGQGQESGCQLNTSLYLYINVTIWYGFLYRPIDNPHAWPRAYLLGISVEGKIWQQLGQPTLHGAALSVRTRLSSLRLEQADAKNHLYFKKTV